MVGMRRLSTQCRVLACIVLFLAILMASTCSSPSSVYLLDAHSPDAHEELIGVGVGDGTVLALLRGGTVCEVSVEGFTAYSVLIVNGSTAVAFGAFKGHPALTMLSSLGCEFHAITYYVSVGKGALFSGVVEEENVFGVGYVALNNTYAGLMISSGLVGEGASASIYVFGVPAYFRDVIILNDSVAIATGVGLSGRYYPALALISGNVARLTALSPSVGGLEGFAVKAIVMLRGGEPAVLTLRSGKAVLVSVTSKGSHAYVAFPSKRFEGVALVVHPRREETVAVLEGVSPITVMFPHADAALLPLASRYYLVMANGSVLTLSSEYRVLTPHGKLFRVEITPFKLEGFRTTEYFARGEHVNVTVFEISPRISVVNSLTNTTSQHVTPTGTSAAPQSQITRGSGATPGFTLVSSGGEGGLLLIVVGCALIFASFLLKKFIGV